VKDVLEHCVCGAKWMFEALFADPTSLEKWAQPEDSGRQKRASVFRFFDDVVDARCSDLRWCGEHLQGAVAACKWSYHFANLLLKTAVFCQETLEESEYLELRTEVCKFR
jgi:hypothetical protein